MTELSEYIGQQIKRLRKEYNWSQDELTKKLDTTKTSISNYETSNRTPYVYGIYRLSVIFDVPVDTFFPPRDSAPQQDNSASEEVIDRLDKIVDLLETIKERS